MTITTGDVLTFKHFQEQAGQQILNVFHMKVLDASGGDPTGYYDIARGFYFQWANSIRSVQTTALQHLRTECTPLTGLEIGIYSNPTPVLGSDVGQPLPTMNAASIQFVRTTRVTRHGWKRIGGLTEGAVTLNDLTAAALTLINTAIGDCLVPAGAEYQQIDEAGDNSGTLILAPVIVGDPIAPDPLYRINDVTSVVAKSQVTTQNTRKVGRGS
jgi:hypothetical protein